VLGGGVATLITVLHRSQRWTMALPSRVACIATWHTGHGRGGPSFDVELIARE
jgi:hypothetical protein